MNKIDSNESNRRDLFLAYGNSTHPASWLVDACVACVTLETGLKWVEDYTPVLHPCRSCTSWEGACGTRAARRGPPGHVAWRNSGHGSGHGSGRVAWRNLTRGWVHGSAHVAWRYLKSRYICSTLIRTMDSFTQNHGITSHHNSVKLHDPNHGLHNMNHLLCINTSAAAQFHSTIPWCYMV